MPKKEFDTCELLHCKTSGEAKVPVFDNVGDGAWIVWICEDCAERLGLEPFDDLPEGGWTCQLT